jgi:hypothetical protein
MAAGRRAGRRRFAAGGSGEEAIRGGGGGEAAVNAELGFGGAPDGAYGESGGTCVLQR